MKAKLIHIAEHSWLPTIYPVYYYGMPNDTVYVIWVRPYTKPSGKTNLEVVVEQLENWEFNYEEVKLYDLSLMNKKDIATIGMEGIDRYNQKMVRRRAFKGFNMPPTKHLYEGLARFCYHEIIKRLEADDLKLKAYCEKLERKEQEEQEAYERGFLKENPAVSRTKPPKGKSS